MTNSTTAQLIADAIENSGKTQREIATEMGFDRSNVISMLKHGEMRMPIERIPAFCKSTGIDPMTLIHSAMQEYMPETWEVLERSTSGLGRQRAFPEAQISIRGPEAVIGRFKQLCADDRRTYAEMLELLMIACGRGPE